MKINYLLFLIIILTACNSKTKETEVQEEKIATNERKQIVRESNYQNRVNISEELTKEWNDHLVEIKDSVLSLCSYLKLYNPFGSFNTHFIGDILSCSATRNSGENTTHSVYKTENVLVEIIHWKDPYSEQSELFFGDGYCKSEDIEFKYGIKVGMTKKDFFSRFFILNDSLLNQINTVSVCADERGEDYTMYRFEEEKLVLISFGN